MMTIRTTTPADSAACGTIIYEAFKALADRHGFPPDFPSADAATGFAAMLTGHPAVFGVVAEVAGDVAGSGFLWERDPIRGVGPITVEPPHQAGGIGRQIMVALLERAHGAAGIRLVQEPHNTSSIALYTSLGFDVKEPLLLMEGRPAAAPMAGHQIRPLTQADIGACDALATAVHGFGRGNEVRDAVAFLDPFVVERQGRITGYLTAATFWPTNHGVAETDEDMQALILGAAAASGKPVAFILPSRQAALLRWCLREGLRVVKPATLMAIGTYHDPKGSWFPSILY